MHFFSALAMQIFITFGTGNANLFLIFGIGNAIYFYFFALGMKIFFISSIGNAIFKKILSNTLSSAK